MRFLHIVNFTKTKKMKKTVLSFALLFSLLLSAQQVTTIAGSGTIGSTNANGTAASFNYPEGVAVDASGNIYVADFNNHRIRKISPSGDVTTFAGSGTAGAIDDTGTLARFNNPSGIVIDALGNFFVSDYSNNKIRKITPTGVVTTVAGSGTIGSNDGQGISATFNAPYGLNIDTSGNIYVADTNNHKIRKIDTSGNVTTLAGTGLSGSIDGDNTVARFKNPSALAIDAQGNVYVADYGNHKIRKITPTGDVSTLAGSGTLGSADGTGTAASFYRPNGIAIDPNGYLYVADLYNNKIRKITPSGDVSTFAGTGVAGYTDGDLSTAKFYRPIGITIDSNGDFYIGDTYNHRIRKITQTLNSNNFNNSSNIKVYPNPTNGSFFIDSTEKITLTIYDILGKIVYKNNSIIGKNSVNLSNLNSGIYLIHTKNETGKTKTIKMIKN